MRGNGWNVFGTILLVLLIDIAVNIVAAIIGAALGDAGRGVVDWIAATLTAPIVALTSSVLYFALLGGATPAQREGSSEGRPRADRLRPPSADGAVPAAVGSRRPRPRATARAAAARAGASAAAGQMATSAPPSTIIPPIQIHSTSGETMNRNVAGGGLPS